MKKIQQGFTLIELMIVVAIIGILAAVAIPAYQDYIVKAKLSKVTSTLDPVKMALAMYYQEQGSFPGVADTITGPGTPGVGSVWTSLGFSSYPTLPAEVGALNYIPLGAAGTPPTATSFAMNMVLANVKAGSINGMVVGLSPSSDIVITGATSATSSSNEVTGGSALTWTYGCHKGAATSTDNVVKKYFNNAGAPLVC